MPQYKSFSGARPPSPPFFAIGIVSGCAIAYEILLMRLFSIIQWHHFAYMIISLAMLGYGASGTFLVFFRQRLQAHFETSLLGNIILFSLSLLSGFLLGQHIPFNPEQIFWDGYQLVQLAALSLLLALPFFFAANTVALAFIRHKGQIAGIYAADLVGAGLGSLVIILLLFSFFPLTALKILAAAGFLAAAAAWLELGLSPWRSSLIFVLAALLPFILPSSWTRINFSPYKGLSQQLRIPGSRIIAEKSSPLALLTVVENKTVPLRHAPGLSLNASGEPPPQLGVFTDGDAMTVITQGGLDWRRYSYFDQMTSALPYHLADLGKVLVIGGGGGGDVLQARYHRAPSVDVLELDARMADLVRLRFSAFSGNIYNTPGVRLHIGEARGFITTSDSCYDLIQLPLPSGGGASSGLYALHENYLLTTEAFAEYIGHLNENGYLAVTSWIRLPPRETLKVFATAVTAMKESSFADPAAHLLLIRSWQTSTLVIKKSPIESAEIQAMRKFCAERSFDLSYYPGMDPATANQYNILPNSLFYQGAMALLGPQKEDFLNRYKFDLKPATDDSPYFFHFFKWRILPEMLALRGQGGVMLVEWGYLILVATLLQALVLSLIFILLPLLFYGRSRQKESIVFSRWRVFIYFFALGLAFLFLEIAFIQKLILFLSHPLYAASVTLSSFLLFAGLGSAAARKIRQNREARWIARLAIAAICAVGLLYLFVLDPVLKQMMGWPFVIKACAAVSLIAPLAFCMGMAFPLGLDRISEENLQLLPWAWGVNGCASVLSSVLATLIAIHAGFTLVVLASLVLYGVAFFFFPAVYGRSR